MTSKDIEKFQQIVWDFYKENKRAFPWRKTTDPYKILVSEIMLQQTQADRVVIYYNNWIKKFPDFKSLSKATFSQIYPYWQGLGYNRRALALQKLAKEIVQTYGGILPRDLILLERLPGIGPYTARAVSIFSFNRPLTCIETNIRRVFIHHFFVDADMVSDEQIFPLLELALPSKKSRQWHWALMDYGAHLKGAVSNPNRRHKNYTVQSKFEGSLRQIRGEILKNLADQSLSEADLVEFLKKDLSKIKRVLKDLIEEGFVKHNNKRYFLA